MHPVRFLPRHDSNAPLPGVAIDDDVRSALAADAAVAVGVSGGKDSFAVALAVADHLDAIGHRGPRVLIHADLGRVEWKDSLPACERLAAHLGWDLIVVRRAAGDMLARWQGRWAANVGRYAELECVKLILPWSTPALRFCTSELKQAPITSALKRRWPGLPIVNVTGVRREESSARAKLPVSSDSAKLQRRGAGGLNWHAILEWDQDHVLQRIRRSGLALHEAYTTYSMGRVSCIWCIMSSLDDMRAAATCEDNVPLYREMVQLEIDSTFAFQGSRWLGDVAPHLLTDEQRQGLARAQANALLRELAESRVPKHMLYVKGWPVAVPTSDEARLLAQVRLDVGKLIGLAMNYTEADAIRSRYLELMLARDSGKTLKEAVA